MQALPFLDVHVQFRENELDLSVWRKETNTGILLNFNAICPNFGNRALYCAYLIELNLFVRASIYLKSRWES